MQRLLTAFMVCFLIVVLGSNSGAAQQDQGTPQQVEQTVKSTPTSVTSTSSMENDLAQSAKDIETSVDEIQGWLTFVEEFNQVVNNELLPTGQVASYTVSRPPLATGTVYFLGEVPDSAHAAVEGLNVRLQRFAPLSFQNQTFLAGAFTDAMKSAGYTRFVVNASASRIQIDVEAGDTAKAEVGGSDTGESGDGDTTQAAVSQLANQTLGDLDLGSLRSHVVVDVVVSEAEFVKSEPAVIREINQTVVVSTSQNNAGRPALFLLFCVIIAAAVLLKKRWTIAH